jgi:mRNA-degrading endonuclease HigB of HigAB toxin-antitoxin module/uncharacterized protein YbjQ (UPF0145 family)
MKMIYKNLFKITVFLSVFIGVSLSAANTIITQPFEQTEALSDNFTKSTDTGGAEFSWQSSGSVDNSGYLSIPSSGSDQLWTTKQSYSIVDNGVYILRAYFQTEGGWGYGSMGFTSSSTVSASGSKAVPDSTDYSIGMSFHGGGGSFMVNDTHTDLNWGDGLDLNNNDAGVDDGVAKWYLFELKVEDNANNTYDLTFDIYKVDQTTGVKGVQWMTTKTQTLTNTNLKAQSDLYVFFGVDDGSNGGGGANTYRMIGIDNFEIELSANITVTGTQTGSSNGTPPTITSNGGGATASISVAENQTAVTTVTATDANGDSVSYSITGGADSGKFGINNGVLTFNSAPNYESPTDSGGNNTYVVEVTATDDSADTLTDTQTITVTVTVTNVNEAPTDIALDSTSVAENGGANAVVGTLSSTDVDSGDSATYTLVSGTGDTDNGSFNISGTSLRLTSSADYETKSSYSIRVRVTDGSGATYEESFTISITNVNETPTDIALDSTSVAENGGANATVGTLSSTDVDSGDSATYTLVSGTGDTDNGSFNISGTSLRLTSSADYETKSSYSIRVRVTDGSGATYEESFTITVTNVNDAPTDIALSSTTVAENAGVNAVVGTLSSTDEDSGDSATYTLVSGTGDTDNGSFNISGTSLRLTSSADYETKSSYSIRVRVTDGSSATYEESFTISITNVNEAPTDIALDSTSVAENGGANATVGTLSSTDVDSGDSATYTLVSGTGDTDNGSFNISGTSLRLTSSADYETKSSYSIRVRVTDGSGATYEESFTISITNGNEAPILDSITNPTTKNEDFSDFNITLSSSIIPQRKKSVKKLDIILF